jgi:hypothetical protein
MFEVPRLKVKRADALLHEFVATATEFLKSEPYSLLLVEDPAQVHLIGEVKATVPNELGLVLGDALHNLRASLDVLANDAVCQQTGSSKRDASFPMAKDLETFERGTAKNLPGAGTDLVDIIRNCQPFNRTSPWLRRLHDFDIADKHRTSLPVVGNPAFHNIRARQRHTGGTMSIGAVHLDATKVGQKRFMSVAKTMNFEFDPNVNHSFFFAISDELASTGTDVEKAFSEMRKEVISTIEAVEGLFFKPAT